MKSFLTVICAIAALQGALAEQDVQQTIDQVQKAFEDMGKALAQNINTEEAKETVVKKWEEMQHQMQHVQQDIEKYAKEHPDSPVSQAVTKMQEIVNDFNKNNPNFDANLKNFQETATQVGEKFTQQWKEAVEKMSAEGGLKDQLSHALNDWGEKMKKTAGDVETKIKELIQQSQH